MLKKSRIIAVLSVCVMMFAVVEPALAWGNRTGSRGGDAAAYGGTAAVIAGGILTVLTGGLALPLIGAAAAGAGAGYYGYNVEEKSVVKDIAAVGGSALVGVGGVGLGMAAVDGAAALMAGGGAATTAGIAAGTATTAGTAAGTAAGGITATEVATAVAGVVGVGAGLAANSSNKVPPSGGSYREVFTPGQGDKYEIHHMPANSISPLPTNDGPAIRMDKQDHKMTASYGNSIEAQQYRAEQQQLIKDGKFESAFNMDVNDIRSKFGNKYDEEIEASRQHMNQLKLEGKIR